MACQRDERTIETHLIAMSSHELHFVLSESGHIDGFDTMRWIQTSSEIIETRSDFFMTY